MRPSNNKVDMEELVSLSSFLRARLTFKHSNQRNIVGLQKKGEFVRGTFLLEGNSLLSSGE